MVVASSGLLRASRNDRPAFLIGDVVAHRGDHRIDDTLDIDDIGGGDMFFNSTRDSDIRSSIRRDIRLASSSIMLRNRARVASSRSSADCMVSTKPMSEVSGERSHGDIGNKIAAHLFQIMLQRHIHQQHGDDAIINPPQTHAKLAPAVIGRRQHIHGTVAAEDSVEIIAEIGGVDHLGSIHRQDFPQTDAPLPD